MLRVRFRPRFFHSGIINLARQPSVLVCFALVPSLGC